MRPFMRVLELSAMGAAAALLSACTEPAPPASEQSAANESAAVQIKAPAGRYQVDPDHSFLHFSVKHLGLADYIARFTRQQITLDFDPANLAASSVVATIDPASVRTDYSGDYRAGHPEAKFQSWDEELAQSAQFFNAAAYPKIEFRSTRVEQTGADTLRVVGNLSLLGRTHPVTLEAKLTGSSETHPFEGAGGALGFSATGSFKRSDFGMTYLLEPPLIGDAVTIEFDGELKQAKEQAATPAD